MLNKCHSPLLPFLQVPKWPYNVCKCSMVKQVEIGDRDCEFSDCDCLPDLACQFWVKNIWFASFGLPVLVSQLWFASFGLTALVSWCFVSRFWCPSFAVPSHTGSRLFVLHGFGMTLIQNRDKNSDKCRTLMLTNIRTKTSNLCPSYPTPTPLMRGQMWVCYFNPCSDGSNPMHKPKYTFWWILYLFTFQKLFQHPFFQVRCVVYS